MSKIVKYPVTRRHYLTYEAVLRGSPIFLAIEAVASVAIEHPEWDMNEVKTWDEWRAQEGR